MRTRLLLAILFASASHAFAQHSNEDEIHGLNINNIDTTIRPQDDFFLHVNGNWINETKIPEDQGSWGSFNELRDRNSKLVLELVSEAGFSGDVDYTDMFDEDKARLFYAIGMDSGLAEGKHIEPLLPSIEKIESIVTIDDLLKYLSYENKIGGSSFFGFSIFPDLMNSNVYATYLSQGGLGLPDKDYYTKTDPKSIELREKYVKHIETMLEFGGFVTGDLHAKSKAIFELENRLAMASMNGTEMRNIPALYNPRTLDQLKDMTPSIDWYRYLKYNNIGDVETIIVMQPDFFKELEKILVENDLELWKDYLRWNIVNTYADYLNEEVVLANFEFYGKELSGAEKPRPRWKKVLANTNGAMGEAIGKLYVEKVFPPEAKRAANLMVDDILEAMKVRINNLDWMTDETKKKALDKLASFTVKIGYPDVWKDYSQLAVLGYDNEGVSYAQNVMNARQWRFEDMVSKLHKPVDKNEWGMTPQTVNAYYSPLNNEIVFPAAILQPPFFDFNADAPVNYGGIGAVIGHEVSHGFDDNGSRFDAKGNMVNWWTEEDLKNFQNRGEQLVAQYSAYEPQDSLFVNGQLTLGENIGDLGGINLAWDALQMYFSENGKTESIDGYTPEQRFFMSWGTIWRTKYRDEAMRSQVMTNPHSPGMYRANGPLMNLDAFYEAFDVKEGDAMYKPKSERIVIW